MKKSPAPAPAPTAPSVLRLRFIEYQHPVLVPGGKRQKTIEVSPDRRPSAIGYVDAITVFPAANLVVLEADGKVTMTHWVGASGVPVVE